MLRTRSNGGPSVVVPEEDHHAKKSLHTYLGIFREQKRRNGPIDVICLAQWKVYENLTFPCMGLLGACSSTSCVASASQVVGVHSSHDHRVVGNRAFEPRYIQVQTLFERDYYKAHMVYWCNHICQGVATQEMSRLMSMCLVDDDDHPRHPMCNANFIE
jgi:hypothetical protein